MLKAVLNMNRALPTQIESMDPALAAVLRTKTPAEKIEMVAAANRTARLLAAAGVRLLHPDWNESRVQAEVIRRVSGGTN
jgi:hypothetical protein